MLSVPATTQKENKTQGPKGIESSSNSEKGKIQLDPNNMKDFIKKAQDQINKNKEKYFERFQKIQELKNQEEKFKKLILEVLTRNDILQGEILNFLNVNLLNVFKEILQKESKTLEEQTFIQGFFDMVRKFSDIDSAITEQIKNDTFSMHEAEWKGIYDTIENIFTSEFYLEFGKNDNLEFIQKKMSKILKFFIERLHIDFDSINNANNFTIKKIELLRRILSSLTNNYPDLESFCSKSNKELEEILERFLNELKTKILPSLQTETLESILIPKIHTDEATKKKQHIPNERDEVQKNNDLFSLDFLINPENFFNYYLDESIKNNSLFEKYICELEKKYEQEIDEKVEKTLDEILELFVKQALNQESRISEFLSDKFMKTNEMIKAFQKENGENYILFVNYGRYINFFLECEFFHSHYSFLTTTTSISNIKEDSKLIYKVVKDIISIKEESLKIFDKLFIDDKQDTSKIITLSNETNQNEKNFAPDKAIKNPKEISNSRKFFEKIQQFFEKIVKEDVKFMNLLIEIDFILNEMELPIFLNLKNKRTNEINQMFEKAEKELQAKLEKKKVKNKNDQEETEQKKTNEKQTVSNQEERKIEEKHGFNTTKKKKK